MLFNNAIVIAIAAFAASPVQARFGGDNKVQAEIAAAADNTLSGESIKFNQAAADPCGKLIHADKIAARKPGPAAINAARLFVHAEKNFNPDVAPFLPTLCQDPTLPTNPELRGILPKVSDQQLKKRFGADGGLTNETANAVARESFLNPIKDNAGKSVAQLFAEKGFKDFVGSEKFTIGAVAPPADKPATPPADKPATPPPAPATGGNAATGNAANGNAAGADKAKNDLKSLVAQLAQLINSL